MPWSESMIGCICMSLSCCMLDKVQCLGVRRHFKAINTHNPQSDLIHPEKNWPQYFQNGLQNEATVILPFMSGSQNLPFSPSKADASLSLNPQDG